MEFQVFWIQLQDELEYVELEDENLRQEELRQDQKFKTLKQKKPFAAYFSRNGQEELFVRIMIGDKDPRGEIRVNEFEGVWNNVKKYPHLKLDKIKNKLLVSYKRKYGETGTTINVPYITALIQYIVKDQGIE